MENLDGTMIFWLIAIGMIAGAIAQVSIWKKGVKITTNILFGSVGSVILGSLGIFLQFPGTLVFAFLGSLAILFILNVFNLQPELDH